MLFTHYSKLVLGHPRKVLFFVALFALITGIFLQDFKLDASADSLVVEGDPDLEYSRQINARYGATDLVFIAYTPSADLFSEPELGRLTTLRNSLATLEGVASVDSILSVPLFKVANASLTDVADNLLTLESPDVDPTAARADLMSNEAYLDVLLSRDGLTTALVVNLETDQILADLLTQRSQMRKQFETDPEIQITAADQRALRDVESSYELRKGQQAEVIHQQIAEIRGVLENYRAYGDIHMGGVPMIADDLITFVRNDIETFGLVILLFMLAALTVLFRKLRYVLLPMTCGALIALVVMGMLGFFGWPVTVISSNFVSLLLIITVSLTVHLIVRYRELEEEQPALDHAGRINAVLESMLEPCAYTSLTTLVAFGSLVISDIPPIIDFGWMMVIGVLTAFVLTFLVFPAMLVLLGGQVITPARHALDMTPAIGRFTERNGGKILVASICLGIASVIGLGLLKVENSFIDYFDDQTEIYQGMVAIDQRLGGTTPLDVIVDMSRPVAGNTAGTVNVPGAKLFGEDPFAEAEGEWDEDEGKAVDPDSYWFTSDKMQRITGIHQFLDDLPETGKVLSLATLLGIAYELNDNQSLNSLELGILYNRIPADYKETLLKPYVSVADDQVRFSIRVRESDPNLIRNDLLTNIRQSLEEKFDLAPAQIHLTGMLVLYNNMLQSLFQSQILTLSVVMAVIFMMFIVLFRSLPLAVIGIIPNLLAAISVLGLMGWLGIPLDMMTITIASISVGIGVDNTIHYIHRYQKNFRRLGNYRATMHYCHGSIGKAMYYTSFTIVAGFSILVLSNFVPTVYFGLLTSLAMLLALAGSLTLLPQLIITFRPLGAESQGPLQSHS